LAHIKIRPSRRKYGKNNYNKYEATIQEIVWGLDNCFTITDLCRNVGLAHTTVVKYLYKLINQDYENIFALCG